MDFINDTDYTEWNVSENGSGGMGSSECPVGSYLNQPGVRAALMACYILVFICCVFGNVVTLVVISIQPSMRSSTNFFLANLAVADLMVGIFCVVQNFTHILVFGAKGWPLGGTMCRLYVFMLYLVPSVSAGILVLLSIERYIAVLHPMIAKQVLTPRVLGCLTVGVWMLAIAANVPHYITAHYFSSANYSYCGKRFNIINLRDLYTANFAFWYCLPLLTLAGLYLRIGVVLWKSASGYIMRSRAYSRHNKSSSIRSTHTANNSFRKPLHNQTLNSDSLEGDSRKYGRTVSNGSVKFSFDRPLSFEEDYPLSHLEHGRDRSSTVGTCESDNIDREPKKSLRGRFRRSSHAAKSSANSGNDTADSRRKVVRLLAAVIVAFAALTLPNHARLLWMVWTPKLDLCSSSPIMLIQPICFLLLFANSGINPILYAFLSARFRQAVRNSVTCRNQTAVRRSRYLSQISENPQF